MNDQPDATTDVEEETPSPLDEYGAGLAERLGGSAVVEFDTVRIYVDRDAWVETLRRARDEEGLTHAVTDTITATGNVPGVGSPGPPSRWRLSPSSRIGGKSPRSSMLPNSSMPCRSIGSSRHPRG